MKRSLGRIKKTDDRDRRHLLQPPQEPTVTSRSWRCGPVLDQGDEPSCVGHAWAAWFECSPIKQRPISPSGIYSLAKKFDEWDGDDYDGTSVRGGANVLSVTGHVREYSWCWDADTAIRWVLANGPLVLGVDWYDGMFETDEDGYIRVDGGLEGGHAVLMFGVNGRSEYVRIRNSWGEEWGDRGNCKLSYQGLHALLSDGGECCAATEVRL